MAFKKILLSLLACTFLAGFIFVYFIQRASNYYDSACERMKGIAADSEKIQYIERWVNKKISDPSFLKALGAKRKIFLDGSKSDLSSKMDLDFGYLGLSNQAAYVAFNRSYEDREKFMDKSKIQSFSIGTGRFGLIIDLNDPNQLGLEWPNDRLSQLHHVNEKVLVVCE